MIPYLDVQLNDDSLPVVQIDQDSLILDVQINDDSLPVVQIDEDSLPGCPD